MKSKTTKKYKKEQRYFVEKEKIEKYLICPICQEIFDEPYRITCGHTFCKACLNKWEKKSKNELCPLCREGYIKKFSGKDLIAQSMVNDSLVTCIYEGCPWKDKLVNLQNHIQTCLFAPEKIPSFMKNSKFFEEEKTKKKGKKKQLDEDSEEDIGNICSFNYTSSIKERVFSRNPDLVVKLFGEENKEKKEDKKIEKNKEKISENEDVNDLYNFLLFAKQNNDNMKINIPDNKEKEIPIEKNSENNNGNEQKSQSSSIMNIFINPTISLDTKTFLNKKTGMEKK